MSDLSSSEMYRRMDEFPEAIRRLSMNNPLIRRTMEMYAHEQILTKEEALCQMVVQLSANWRQIAQDYERVIRERGNR